MASEEKPANLSPTFLKVMDKFITALHADDGVEGDVINRLENLIKQKNIPKLEEINDALFQPPTNSET